MFLAMPRCASTAIEAAFGSHADICRTRPPRAKHRTYRLFAAQDKAAFAAEAGGPLETICLFREPVSWLESWWRYRARANIPNAGKSTAEMSFDAFVQHYLDCHEGPSKVGRQAHFIADTKGEIGVDHLFAFERLDEAMAWLSARVGRSGALTRRNAAPHRPDVADLSRGTRSRLEQVCARDFEIHAKLLASGKP